MYLEVIIRLVVAAVLGSLIGLERERLDRGAGLRTHALVATASALIIIDRKSRVAATLVNAYTT